MFSTQIAACSSMQSTLYSFDKELIIQNIRSGLFSIINAIHAHHMQCRLVQHHF